MGHHQIFSFLFLTFFLFYTIASPLTQNDVAEKFKTGSNKFSLEFYKATSENQPGKSVVMSPLSAEVLLALLSLGAKGETRRELSTALYLEGAEYTKTAFKSAIDDVNNMKGVTLNMANKIYVKEGEHYTLDTKFQKNAEKVFRAELQNVNFSQKKKTADIINSWVESKTNSKIQNLIDQNGIDEQAAMVLVNAIYFKGDWKLKFDRKSTFNADFFISKTEKKQVDMMSKSDDFKIKFIREWKAKMLEIPYKDDAMSMIILLPNTIEGLKDIEDKVASNPAELKLYFNTMSTMDVLVYLPKFKIETTINLKEILPQMGISKIFSSEAELDGLLSSGQKLKISKGYQKAFIEVNEDGAEAAAATYFQVQAVSMPPTVRADHPFMFFIVDNHKNIIFSGKYTGTK